MDLILAIESSCDETSLALLDISKVQAQDEIISLNQIQVLDSIISSQIDIHAKYGGVIPEIGARQHAGQIHLIYKELLDNCQAKYNLDLKQLEAKISLIKVTTTPGLISALRVGLEFAKSLKFFLQDKYQTNPQIKQVNHLQGHFSSCFYHPENQLGLDSKTIFPHLHLLVSGGNTQLLLANSLSDYQIVGQTGDDAAGECFDKIGRMAGLPYPGGVWISKIIGTLEGNPCNFTVPLHSQKNLQFSYSGLKTAVRYYLQAQDLQDWSFEKKLTTVEIELLISYSNNQSLTLPEHLSTIYEVILSSHTVAIQHLVQKIKLGIQKYQPLSLGLSGGVSANTLLRQQIQSLGLPSLLASKALTGDNAVMIGLVIQKKLA